MIRIASSSPWLIAAFRCITTLIERNRGKPGGEPGGGVPLGAVADHHVNEFARLVMEAKWRRTTRSRCVGMFSCRIRSLCRARRRLGSLSKQAAAATTARAPPRAVTQHSRRRLTATVTAPHARSRWCGTSPGRSGNPGRTPSPQTRRGGGRGSGGPDAGAESGRCHAACAAVIALPEHAERGAAQLEPRSFERI